MKRLKKLFKIMKAPIQFAKRNKKKLKNLLSKKNVNKNWPKRSQIRKFKVQWKVIKSESKKKINKKRKKLCKKWKKKRQ